MPLIYILIFILLFNILGVTSDWVVDETIKYEAKNGKEFPIPFFSAGDCRVKAVEKAYELKDATILFIKNNSIHTIAIDKNNLVYDLSTSAQEFQKKEEGNGKDINFNGMNIETYKGYVSLDNVIYKVKLKDKKIMSGTEVLSKDNSLNAPEYKNYVSVFIQEKHELESKQ